MKAGTWGVGAAMISILAGGIFVCMGLFSPGRPAFEENPAGTAKSMVAEARKKAGFLQEAQQKAVEAGQEFARLKINEGEHRVFVSAQLVYLPEAEEPVQPLDPKMVTEDGIEVGWKIQYDLDPKDPRLKDLDLDGDGFTNLEEFKAKTNPKDKADSPAKESTLKSRAGDPLAMAVSFPEKSGGLYSLRFQVGAKRREFKGKPGDFFWVMAGSDMVEIFTEEVKMTAARSKAKQAGQNSHVIPLKFLSYEEKLEKVKDVKAGGVEVEVDNSVVLIERQDAASGTQQLVFSTPQRPQVLFWDVGDIRFYTPVGGGTELGPYRVGETFPFEGKEFSILAREGRKILLQNRAEPNQQSFWVPPVPSGETSSAAP